MESSFGGKAFADDVVGVVEPKEDFGGIGVIGLCFDDLKDASHTTVGDLFNNLVGSCDGLSYCK